MADSHQSALSTPVNSSDQEPAGDGMFSLTRLSSAAASGSNPSGGTRPSRGAANDFIDALLDSAPKPILELASGIMGDISNSRALLPTDVAAAVGCVLVYYMERTETVAFLQSLDDPQSERFMVALALRTHADVRQLDMQQGRAVLPGTSARLTPPGERRLGAAQDLEKTTLGISNGEIATERVLTEAAIAMTEAATRFASKAGSNLYSPLAQPFMTTAPATRSSPLCTSSEEVPARAAIAAEGANARADDFTNERAPVYSATLPAAYYSSRNTPLLSAAFATTPLCTSSEERVAIAAAALASEIRPTIYNLNTTGTNIVHRNSSSPSFDHGHSHTELAPPGKPAVSSASPPTSPAMDRLIQHAVGTACDEREAHTGAHGAVRAAGDLAALHTTLCESAIEELLHLDPNGLAAEAFRRMMHDLLNTEIMQQYQINFGDYIASWVRCMCEAQHVPALTFAGLCTAMVLELQITQLQSSALGGVPVMVMQRIDHHAAQRDARSRGGKGRGAASAAFGFASLGNACADPVCEAGCGESPREIAARLQHAAVEAQRDILRRKREELEQQEQAQRQQVQEMNFALHHSYTSGASYPALHSGSGSTELSGPRPTKKTLFELPESVTPPPVPPVPPVPPLPPVMPPLPPLGTPAPVTPSGAAAPVIALASALVLPPPVEDAPLFHTPTVGGGRQGPTETLTPYAVIRDSTPVDKISLKAPIMTVDKLSALIDLGADDYDGWLSNRNALIKLLCRGYVQSRARLDRITAMDATRDSFKEAFSSAPKMNALWRRTHKKIGTDPSTAEADCLSMIFAIDKHCIPVRANAIEMTINRRTFKIGEESIVEYLRDVTTMALGHMPIASIRRFFMVKLEEALDAAEATDSFELREINDVRDNLLELEGELPDDLDELHDVLIKRSSLRSIWVAKNGPAKRVRGIANPALPSRGAEDASRMAETNLADALAAINARLANLQTGSPTLPPPGQPPPSPPPQGVPAPPPVGGMPSANAALASLASTLQTAITAFGDASGGSGKGKGGGGGGGKGGGKGGYQRVLWNLPAIIATNLIWPADTPITWDNAERRGRPDGVDDGLFGIACPFCGNGRRTEMTQADFRAANGGKGPGSGWNKAPCPSDVSLVHRALECGIASRRIERFLSEHPEHKDTEPFRPMTEEQLATFKAIGG